jgi:hypothetical protein
MASTREDELLALAIAPSQVREDGPLTLPRSFGDYRLTGTRSSGRMYRFGNHPVRQRELIAEYGGAHLEALFLKRPLAEELASRRNARKE